MNILPISTILIYGSLIIFVLILIFNSVYIVKQAEVLIIERLGKFHRLLRSGIHFILPFIDKPRSVYWTFLKESNDRIFRLNHKIEIIDLREAVYDFPKQNVITKDNVTMQINALLYYQITDPFKAVYEVNNLPQAIEKLTQTTLRNVIGALDLDETLVSRDQINEKLRDILDEATDKWGVKVNRVELQEVNPPKDIRVAMEKQMRAERDRRAYILEAEGKKRSMILEAEGIRQSKITEAKGEAEARLLIAEAESNAIKKIQDAVPNTDPLPYMIALSYIEILPKIMNGKNDKMILMPYETSSLVSTLGSIKEIFKSK